MKRIQQLCWGGCVACLIITGCGGTVPDGRDERRADTAAITEVCGAVLDRDLECTPEDEVNPESVAEWRSMCRDDPFGAADHPWLGSFTSALGECIRDLPCNDVENFDDICVDQALADVNHGTLSDELLDACVLGGGTETCRDAVRDSGANPPNPVTLCLERWASCEPLLFNEAFWVEDYCLTLLAQPNLAPDSAGCLELECGSVGVCLQEHGGFAF